MNTQEREHWDYEIGAASELQNAFAESRMQVSDDSAKIAELVAAGRFVVVENVIQFCPSTDASLGEFKYLSSDHATRNEAVEIADQRYGYGDSDCMRVSIEPPLPIQWPASPVCDNSEIPF